MDSGVQDGGTEVVAKVEEDPVLAEPQLVSTTDGPSNFEAHPESNELNVSHGSEDMEAMMEAEAPLLDLDVDAEEESLLDDSKLMEDKPDAEVETVTANEYDNKGHEGMSSFFFNFSLT